MSHFKSNLDDITFNLFTKMNTHSCYAKVPFQEYDKETASTILEEINKLAVNILADSYTTSDTNPPQYSRETYTAILPEDFKNAYKALMDAEWFRLDLPEELEGNAAPPSLRWAAAELLLGANPGMFFYMAGPLFAAILQEIGTEDQRKLAQHIVNNKWGATMVLTEPDAGSDVGAGRTIAIPQPDGTWHIEGIKRFITSGEHDLSENIIHFVLARPVNTEGAGGPGTKGLSLFLVPKYHTNFSTGEISERNGVYATNVENKMGLKVSTTCELTFGQHGTPAVGYLVGNRHTGIKDMFRIIEWARMMVGTKSMAQLSTAYLNALDYAKIRIQGADLTEATDKTAPRVAIITHPDVRRMLMLLKSYTEALRAIILYTAQWQDRYETAKAEGNEAEKETAHYVNDFLLPIVKGYSSEKSAELLPQAMQILGGSGYLHDYPIEQYIRDQHIDKLYEGVTHIQAQDFLFRKIFKNQFRALTTIMQEMEITFSNSKHEDSFAKEKAALMAAKEETQKMLELLGGWSMSSLGEDKTALYKVGENANRFLSTAGTLLAAWLLIRQAEVAKELLDEGNSDYSVEFLEGKVLTARFFIANVLPDITRDLRIVEQAEDSVIMQINETSF